MRLDGLRAVEQRKLAVALNQHVALPGEGREPWRDHVDADGHRLGHVAQHHRRRLDALGQAPHAVAQREEELEDTLVGGAVKTVVPLGAAAWHAEVWRRLSPRRHRERLHEPAKPRKRDPRDAGVTRDGRLSQRARRDVAPVWRRDAPAPAAQMLGDVSRVGAAVDGVGERVAQREQVVVAAPLQLLQAHGLARRMRQRVLTERHHGGRPHRTQPHAHRRDVGARSREGARTRDGNDREPPQLRLRDRRHAHPAQRRLGRVGRRVLRHALGAGRRGVRHDETGDLATGGGGIGVETERHQVAAPREERMRPLPRLLQRGLTPAVAACPQRLLVCAKAVAAGGGRQRDAGLVVPWEPDGQVHVPA